MRQARLLAEEIVRHDHSWPCEQIGEQRKSKGWAAGVFRWLTGILADRRVILSLRIVLAVMFLVSAVGKLIDINRYSVGAVYQFNILPVSVAHIYGLALPFIELACALGLLFGVLTRLSASGIGALSLSFFVAKAIILSRGQDIACGCFGPITSTLASVSIFADPPIMIMSLAVMLSPDCSRNWFSLGKRLWAKTKGARRRRGARSLTLALPHPRRGISSRD